MVNSNSLGDQAGSKWSGLFMFLVRDYPCLMLPACVLTPASLVGKADSVKSQ